MTQRRKKITGTALLTLILLAGMAMGVYYVNRYWSRPAFVHYAAFGIDIPTGYPMHGIDVSRHQQEVNWDDVKAMNVKGVKINFAFIKATEGLDDVDEQFDRNWSNAGEAGMIKGAYHFFIASKSGKAQAENFIETVQLKKGDLPPVLDVEQTYGASVTDLQQRVSDWLQAVQKKYRVKPIIYTNADFYKVFLAGRFDDYPFWVAHYLVPDKPRTDRDWVFWQYNEAGHVNGIRTYVDFNAFYGDSAAFQKILLR